MCLFFLVVVVPAKSGNFLILVAALCFLDTSGSMSKAIGGKSRLEHMKQAVIETLQLIK